jgi:hypothetical protein
MADYHVGSGYSLSGGTLSGSLAVSSFSGLKMEVEVSSTSAGNQTGGKRKLEPRPGPTKPGKPTFTVPIAPNAKQGTYQPEDLTFTFEGGDGKVAEWQLKQCFPMSYEVSEAKADSAELSAETIQIAVTEIERMQ